MTRMIECTADRRNNHEASSIVMLTVGRQYPVLAQEDNKFLVSNDCDNHVWYDRFFFGKELTPHKWAKEIHAWADGAAIQRKVCAPVTPCHDWENVGAPQWGTAKGIQYRIKPTVDQLAIDQLKDKLKACDRSRQATYDRLRAEHKAISDIDDTIVDINKQLLILIKE